MPDILASVSVVLGAEVSGFKAAMADARKELRGLVQFSEGLKDIGGNLTSFVSLPILGLGAAAVAASGKIESLGKGLQAITLQELGKQGVTGLTGVQQAAQLTQQRLVELREIAKTPGLGFEGAVQGDVRLRAVGIDAEQSAKSIKAFANAVATTGGGKSEFDRVTVQLAQLSAKGKVLAQDLRPIIEAAPAVSGALQRLYGTVDSETISKSLAKQGQSSTDFVKALTDELAKLPQVEGGLKNAFENLSDTATLSLAKIGDSISKSLNLPSLVAKFSDALSGIAEAFTSLSPGVQTGIVAFAGFVAAAGPVLLAVGTIGAALPVLTAGFALLSGPVGIGVAAFAALGVGLAVVAGSSRNVRQEFTQQRDAVAALDQRVVPLIARYDELKGKSSLTTDEQAELRQVVQQVGEQIPTTVTAFDQYGKALDINSAAARDFVAQQRAILAIKNKDALTEQRQEYTRLTGQIRGTLNALNQLDEKGQHVKAVFDEGGGGYQRLTNQEISDLTLKLNTLLQARQGVGGLIDELKGIAPVLQQAAGAAGPATAQLGLLAELEKKLKDAKDTKPDLASEGELAVRNVLIESLEKQIKRLNELGVGSKKAQEALAKLRTELASLTQLDDVLARPAEGVDTVNRRVKVLEGGLLHLLEAGVSPSSKAFQQFATEALTLQQGLDKLQASANLDFKPTSFKLKATVGDFNPDQVGKLGAELENHPVLVPFTLAPLKTDFSKDLLDANISLGKSFELASAQATLFSGKFDTFDYAGARAQALREKMEDLLSKGLDPTSQQLQQLKADYDEATRASDAFNAGVQRNQQATQLVQSAFYSMAGGISDAFATITSGTGDFGTVLEQTLLSTVGSVATELGGILLASGLGIEALKVSLATFSGVGAIAAGIGLLAIGGLAKGAAAHLGQSGGGSGSGASSPSAANYGQSSGTQKIVVQVESRLRGRDLVAVGRAEAYRVKRTG